MFYGLYDRMCCSLETKIMSQWKNETIAAVQNDDLAVSSSVFCKCAEHVQSFGWRSLFIEKRNNYVT